jgi:hypothetical protein
VLPLCRLDIRLFGQIAAHDTSNSTMSHISFPETDELCPDESISQVMIGDELEERDISSNSGSYVTQEGATDCLPSLRAYFIVNSDNIEEGRAFLKVQNSVMKLKACHRSWILNSEFREDVLLLLNVGSITMKAFIVFYRVQSSRTERTSNRTMPLFDSTRFNRVEPNSNRNSSNRTETLFDSIYRTEICVRLDRTESSRVEPNCVRFDQPSLFPVILVIG